MHSYIYTKGIRFNDCVFSEPTPLPGWTLPRFAGLFAVLAHDANWAPKPYQPLCFGELGNNGSHPLLASDFGRLVASAGCRTLLVSVLPMPFSTTAQRGALRQELIAGYNPTCQLTGNNSNSRELSHRVDEIEQLLSNLARMFEPQPVPPRRPIGFQPAITPDPAHT